MRKCDPLVKRAARRPRKLGSFVSSKHIRDRPVTDAADGTEVSFSWGIAKLRIAALALVGAAIAGAIGFAFAGALVKWACLAWLLGVATRMHRLSRLAADEASVLTIDKRGILDRRLMPRRIEWQEIALTCPVDPARSHVVDLELRRPRVTLAGTQWRIRIGAWCQTGYGVPAVTISMLLLDGDVHEVLEAIARYRPDLLHPTNRQGFRTALAAREIAGH